jgi:hypothetical protein
VGKFDFTKVNLEQAAIEVYNVAATAIETAQQKWLAVAGRYHEFTFELVQRGFID